MKVLWSWTTVLGIMLVAMAGCGDTDDPIRQESSSFSSEPRLTSDPRIFGSWHLQETVWFKEGVETQRIDSRSIGYGLFAPTITFMPDGLFHAMSKFPIEKVTTLSWLEWLGLEHLQDQDIIVTFRGKFQINDNELWLDLTSAIAKPKEAGDIDSDFADEQNLFIYYLGDPGLLDFSFDDDNNLLEFTRQEGIYMVKFLHSRVEGE